LNKISMLQWLIDFLELTVQSIVVLRRLEVTRGLTQRKWKS